MAVRVLVVDDDASNRDLIAEVLADEGHDVAQAGEGACALAMLAAWPADLILLDLLMPEMDGWAFRARQLATPRSADVPVIMLSAARDVRVEALRPAAFVPKPFDLEHLLATVANLAV